MRTLFAIILLLSTTASAKDWRDDDCDKPEPPPCISGYDWLWFVAINNQCEAAKRWHADDPGRRFKLCYVDRAGNVFLWKRLRFMSFAEMQFEADLRNAAQDCGER